MSNNSVAISDWIKLPSSVSATSAEALSSLASKRLAQRIEGGKFTADNVYYVSKVDVSACKGELDISDKQLEKLRHCCMLWDIDLRPAKIESHRKFIGPFIVGFKKILFPIMRVFLKDLIRQQKDFNAAAISAMTELATSKSPSKHTGGSKEG